MKKFLNVLLCIVLLVLLPSDVFPRRFKKRKIKSASKNGFFDVRNGRMNVTRKNRKRTRIPRSRRTLLRRSPRRPVWFLWTMLLS